MSAWRPLLRKLVQSGHVEMVGSFRIEAITRTADRRVELAAGERRVVADTVVNSTGFRPDHNNFISELRLDLDPIIGSTRARTADRPEPALLRHRPAPRGRRARAPEPGYYAVGAKSYGRAPTFLLATGYEQARSVHHRAGDWDAARDVQLDLPETGVCSSNLAYGGTDDEAGSFCGPAPQAVEISAPAGRGLATGISGGLCPHRGHLHQAVGCCG